MGLKLEAWPDHYAVWQLEASSLIPARAMGEGSLGISCSCQELSVVPHQNHVPPEIKAERSWRRVGLVGPFESGLTGMWALLHNRLAKARADIFAVSTYNTDYVLVNTHDLARAVKALVLSGHAVNSVTLDS